jgi:chemotaxis protein CheD
MKAEISVLTGEVWAAQREIILRSDAIGSCIGVAAFEIKSGVGALAHIMLPGSSLNTGLSYNTKYAADAVSDMLFKMTRLGAKSGHIEACLVGAGNVLQDKNDRVCVNLICSVSEVLREHQIRIVAEALGGVMRRCVFIDIGKREVYYTEGDEADRLLYKWSCE